MLLAAMVHAGQGVALLGIMGERALLSVDGGPGRMLRVGERDGAVRLLEIRSAGVVVEQGGRRSEVLLGGSVTVRDAAREPRGDTGRASITADAQGHFTAVGTVNNAPVRFLVDTGASVVALSRSLAMQAGVRLDDGQRALIHTANGMSPAWRVTLNSVQVGDIRLHMVDAVVVEDNQLPLSLLGMSFMNRTDMRREGDLLTLIQRY